MQEVKLTLQQLLSLYTGGRPVGTRDYSTQCEEFLDNYAKLMYLNLIQFKGNQHKESEEFNFKNMSFSIELQYPAIKKIKKLCKDYIKKVPVMYESDSDENILNDQEYKTLTNNLLKEARKVMGKENKFVVKNIKAFSR